MSDIELVIKIPKKVYKAICDKNALGCGVSDIKNIIRNGTPLPKEHGRLIDAGQLPLDIEWEDVENAPTIIETEKEESEEEYER